MEFTPAVELTTNEFGECNGPCSSTWEKAVFRGAGAGGHPGDRRLGAASPAGVPTSNNFGATGTPSSLLPAGPGWRGSTPSSITRPGHVPRSHGGVLVTEAAVASAAIW